MHITVLVARTGDLFVHFDCVNAQSMFVRRDDVSSFTTDARNTRVIVFPPFASVALTCLTAMQPIESVTLQRDDIDPDRFSLLVKNATGKAIAYVADPDDAIPTHTLAAAGVEIVITPKCVGRIHRSDSKSSLAVIASIPKPERPNYPGRFPLDAALVSRAVATAIRTKPAHESKIAYSFPQL